MAMLNVTREAVEAAKAAGRSAPRFGGYVCCARVYIQPVGRIAAASKRLLEAHGLRVMPRAHHSPAIYLGYDNATGIEYGKAEAMAKALSDAGFRCYADADMD